MMSQMLDPKSLFNYQYTCINYCNSPRVSLMPIFNGGTAAMMYEQRQGHARLPL